MDEKSVIKMKDEIRTRGPSLSLKRTHGLGKPVLEKCHQHDFPDLLLT